MHEFSLATGIVEIACDEARKAHADRVRRVTCRAGILRQIDATLLQQAFELAAENTPCAEAVLEVEVSPLHLACPGCGHRFSAFDWDWECPKCHEDATCLEGGDELDVIGVTVEAPEEAHNTQSMALHP